MAYFFIADTHFGHGIMAEHYALPLGERQLLIVHNLHEEGLELPVLQQPLVVGIYAQDAGGDSGGAEEAGKGRLKIFLNF